MTDIDVYKQANYINHMVDNTQKLVLQLDNTMPPFCDDEKKIIDDILGNLCGIKNILRGDL